MKKQQTDIVKAKGIFISLAIISSFLLIINFIPIFVMNAGITSEFTEDLEPDSIAYVNRSNPDMNYEIPLWENSVIGNFTDTFIHFNLDLLPTRTEKLYFIIREYYFDSFYEYPIDDIEINLISVGSNWNSSEITWNNSPKHEEIIDTVNISEIRQGAYPEYYNLEKSIDITELFNANQLNEFSFCINITKNNLVLNTNVFLREIKVVWYYEQVIISNTTIISSVIIFSLLIGTILFIRKDIYSCPECGIKRKFTETVCSSCGKSIKNEILIKGLDYQLLLILLWIFAFFEGSTILMILQTKYYSFLLMPFIIFLILINWVILCIILLFRSIKKYRDLKDS